MSYCRWSSDNFGCDLYVYASDEGFITHVAGNRVLGDVPKLPPWPWEPEEMCEAMNRQSAFLNTAEHAPIGLRYDGDRFVDDTAEDCAQRLEYLRDLGYHVPQGAIDALRAEVSNERPRI